MVFSTFDMDKFGKISPHNWKERLQIIITVKFESDTSLASADINFAKVRKFTDVCMAATRLVWSGGASLCPYHHKTSVKFHDYEVLYFR